MSKPEPEPMSAELQALRDAAARYKDQRDRMLAFMQNADVSSGVCCCGDSMDHHCNEHSPVDMWDHSVRSWAAEIEQSDRASASAAQLPDDDQNEPDDEESLCEKCSTFYPGSPLDACPKCGGPCSAC